MRCVRARLAALATGVLLSIPGISAGNTGPVGESLVNIQEDWNPPLFACCDELVQHAPAGNGAMEFTSTPPSTSPGASASTACT
ncbi:hypothetical protein KDL67_13755 [bacterium]|nr:hypothetical protein [bacterium]